MMEQNEEDDVEDMGSFDENHRFQKKIQTLPPPKQSSIPPLQKKKRVSYDDLLSNMGMKLINGKLELYNTNTQLQQQNTTTYQPSFQEQQHPLQQPYSRQPMTKQQYKKYLALEYLKQQHERNRIGQIKSKKLMFSNPNTISNIHINQNSPMNRLFLIRR